MSAYRLMTDDWQGIGKEHGLSLVKKRQQQYNEEQQKAVDFKIRTLVKLQSIRTAQKSETKVK
jgi:hypothetical protein